MRETPRARYQEIERSATTWRSAWSSLIIGTFTDYTNMGRLFSRNFSRRTISPSPAYANQDSPLAAAKSSIPTKAESVLLHKSISFSRDESRALLPVFDTGNREKPRWKRRFPMTQLVCHEDRTPNRATLFPRSIEVARARTTVIYKPPALRDKIKDENKNDLSRPIVCDSDRRRERPVFSWSR